MGGIGPTHRNLPFALLTHWLSSSPSQSMGLVILEQPLALLAPIWCLHGSLLGILVRTHLVVRQHRYDFSRGASFCGA